MKINGEYVDKLLSKLKRNASNYEKLLQLFLKELEYLKIHLTEELYSNLKYSSKELKDMLDKLGILSFNLEELLNYANGKYDFYLRIKPSNMSLIEAIKLIDYYLNFFSLDKETIKRNKDSIEYKKLELIITNYNRILDIHALFRDMFPSYTTYDLDKVIVSLSLDELNDILNNIYLYKNNKINKDFMYKLNDKYIELIIIGRIFERFFRKIPGINEIEGKELLKKLFFHYDLEARNRIIGFTEHRLSGRTKDGSKAWNNIETMQRQYKKAIVEGLPCDKTLEDYFPLYPGVSITVQNRIIERLFATISPDRRRDIDMYIKGEVTAKSEVGTRARSKIQILQKQYLKELKKINGPIFTYYDAFSDIDIIILEEKKKIVDYVISLLPFERQESLKKYIMGEITQRSELGGLAKSDLQTARKRFNKIATKGLLHKTRYDFFPDLSGVTMEEKCEVVDILLRDISEERKTNIDKLASLEINSSSEEGKKAYNDISAKKKKYGNYVLDRKDFIKNVAKEIKERHGVNLDINISFAKMDLLYMTMKVIEYVFRSKNKGTKKDFMEYFYHSIAQLNISNPNFSIDILIEFFLNLAYEDLKEDVVVRL